jgi:RNA polymerase sigma factor (TIGR02999 family)
MVQADVSELLARWSDGDESALAELTPFVYGELRRLGRSALRRVGHDSILQPTVLVHEAWLKMAAGRPLSIAGRRQFYALAAKIMRDILVDNLRRRRSAKRGGSQIAVALDEANPAERPRCIDFLVLDEAISRLGEIGPRYPRIVELRYLAGLTIDETAEVLQLSHATIEREWKFARAWLRRELSGLHEPEPERLQ